MYDDSIRYKAPNVIKKLNRIFYNTYDSYAFVESKPTLRLTIVKIHHRINVKDKCIQEERSRLRSRPSKKLLVAADSPPRLQ